MSNSHQVILDTADRSSNSAGGAPFDTHEPELALEFLSRMGGGPKKSTAKTTILPKTTSGANEMLAPRMRGGVGKVDPRNPADLVVSIGGIEMSLARAQELGLAAPGADGRLTPTPEVIASKVAEAQQNNAAADAEALVFADAESEAFVEELDAAAVAAGMNGAADVVFAALRAPTPEAVVQVFEAVSPDPQAAAEAFSNLVTSYCDHLGAVMGLDPEELDDAFDAVIAVRGQAAVVAAAIEGAQRRTLTPIIKLLRSRS